MRLKRTQTGYSFPLEPTDGLSRTGRTPQESVVRNNRLEGNQQNGLVTYAGWTSTIEVYQNAFLAMH
jgi:hypothetical protein